MRYISNKAARFGFKIYVLADSKTGYVSRYLLDEGSNTRYIQGNEYYTKNLNTAGKAAMTLLEEARILNKGHFLAVDNLYTDWYFVSELYRNRTDFIGTVRTSRRDLPKTVLGLTRKDFEKAGKTIVTKYNGPFTLSCWLDKKPVRMLSSLNRTTELDGKPEFIHLYNKCMPGVDLNDQIISGRPVTRKRIKKYYLKFFQHLLDTLLVNCFICYNMIPGITQVQHQTFRELLVSEMIRKWTNIDLSNIQIRHPSEVTVCIPEMRKTQIYCAYCSNGRESEFKRNKRKKSRFYCSSCQKSYCITEGRNCFEAHVLLLNRR